MSKSFKQKPKKTKTRERHFFSMRDYEQLEEVIGIVFGNEDNEAKVEGFAGKYEKFKELKLRNADLEREEIQKKKRLDLISY